MPEKSKSVTEDFNYPVTVVDIPGEQFCYHVFSESRASFPHRVELEMYEWNGACGCEAFEFRSRKRLERGERGHHLRCKHIKAAMFYFADKILPAVHFHLRNKKAGEEAAIIGQIERETNAELLQRIYRASFKRLEIIRNANERRK